MTAATLAHPGFGELYGHPSRPSYLTRDGVAVWMWRRGQRVRFYDATGQQVGPEQANVFPAVVYANTQRWVGSTWAGTPVEDWP